MGALIIDAAEPVDVKDTEDPQPRYPINHELAAEEAKWKRYYDGLGDE